ncbi:tRNA (adenosine(37)-N6)-threonylcarbamoyltransferase complex dimerization subunit type 1 TsaB [Paenibacillus sp. GP183]|uniref:tRNA (adenosine(37)-N6)-threonylcarbamoyltransferase complex dimerization subunit type 1 TsaB n=1 Tax=Paenibacillus sp. GP183 TaxID=1882751 RepID=UPI00089D4E75|nr:tRNA (adenosine(37)-N6)-threonylcarbamoyltransferase complex dimerization subunit type 1 TsaB [Paenibacillus sp. GP183]SEC14413.1 tRNA threonylcarbamoyladenosine biosynthesis protein TsaB [Paenibacillus sp. GP183]
MTDILKNSAAAYRPLLAIDTSTSSLTVAVLEKGKSLGELSTYADRNHSIGLLPNIEELLASLALKPKELQAITVGKGPGSYTGVRIGVTAAKTFAWSLGLPLIAVSSLEAMALGGKSAGAKAVAALDSNPNVIQDRTTWFIPLMDARRRQAFTAIYESRGKWNPEEAADDHFDLNNHWRVLIPDTIRVMDPWLEQIANLADDAGLRRNVSGKTEWGAPARLVFVGETEGFASMLANFDEEWIGEVLVVPHLLSAVNIGLLAYPKWSQGELQEVHTFVPNYAQLTEAEVNLSAKSQKGED